MARRLVMKISEYEKDGQTKGEYVELGVILENDKGEYALINPHVDLAGVLMAQRILAQKTGRKLGDKVACSIFDNNQNGGHQAPQQGYQQNYGAMPLQSGRPQQPQRPQQPAPQTGHNQGLPDDFMDDVPF